MRKFSLIATLVLAFGCGKKDKVDQALDDFSGWKDKMCKCADAACAEKTHEDYKKWEDKMEESMKDVDKDKVDKSKLERFEKIEQEMKACRRKFRDAAPPAEGAAPAEPPPAP